MKKNSMRRAVSLIAGSALLLPALAVPASAAPSQAKASVTLDVDDQLVLAGAGKNLGENPFDLTVSNTGAPGLVLLGGGDPSINYIQVVVPSWHTGLTQVADPDGEDGPWEASVDDANNVVVLTGGDLEPGDSLDISFAGTVTDDLANDDFGNFRTSVSENGGQSLANAGPSKVDIDVLEGMNIQATAPIGELPYTDADGDAATFVFDGTDGTVTAGQNNVDLAVGINNRSTEDKDVTATLSGVDGSGSATVSSGEVGTAVVEDVAFGAAGTVVIDADLTAPGADRFGVTTPLEVEVQDPIGFSVGTEIAPAYFGTGEKTLSFSLDKTGVPAGLTDIELNFTGTDDAGLRAPSGTITDRLIDTDERTVELSIPITWDEELHDDGEFDATVTLSGTDDNGAAFEVGPLNLGAVTFDSLLPTIHDLTLTAPPAQVGEARVATNGSSLSFSGTAIDPTTDNKTAPCADCDVTLGLVDDNGRRIATRTISANADGTFSGSLTVESFERPRENFQIHLEGTVSDAATNESEDVATSNLVTVDTLPPAVFRNGEGAADEWDQGAAADGDYIGSSPGARVKALLGGEEGGSANANVIDVVFDELIGGSTSAIQWFVDSNGENFPVQSAEIIDNQKVRLTLTRDLDVNARAVVNHDPTLAGPNQRIFDRVGQRLIGGIVNTIDNIVPEATDILTVDDQGLYQGQGAKGADTPSFFTNLSTYNTEEMKEVSTQISFVAAAVPAGTTLNIRVKAGDQPGNTVTYANSTTNDQTNVEVVKKIDAVFGGVPSDATYTLEVFITDSGYNQSEVLSWPLVIDRADPNAEGARLGEGNELIITATEALRSGREFASDWLVNVTNRDRNDSFPVNEVVGSDSDSASRVLVVDGSYDLRSPDVTVQDGEYVFRGAPSERFVDPAGNRLAKGSVFSFGS